MRTRGRLVVLPVGALLARFGQDRWLSAGGGVLCGADVMDHLFGTQRG